MRAASEKNIRPAKLSTHASKSPHRQNNWCLWQVKWGTFEVQAHALYSSDHLHVDARVRFGSSTPIHESGTSLRRASASFRSPCWFFGPASRSTSGLGQAKLSTFEARVHVLFPDPPVRTLGVPRPAREFRVSPRIGQICKVFFAAFWSPR